MKKKAQHETVGFVLIVIIVTIIGMIFLVLFMTKKDNRQTAEVSNLVQAVMYYTSDCYSQNQEPRAIEELITACHRGKNKVCLDGRNVCDALDTALKKAFDESLRIGDNYKNKAYQLDVYYRGLSSTTVLSNITSVRKGYFANCSSIEGGTHTVTLGASGSGGIIIVDLYVCKSMGTSDVIKGTSSGGLGVTEN